MNIWLQVTSGQGPAECQWVVARVTEEIEKQCNAEGVSCRRVETVSGDQRDTAKSVLLAIEGRRASQLAEAWAGTIKWIGQSPYRPNHKRKNWFVGVDLISQPESPDWAENDLKVDVMRASGPGGQHVNKTSSAVRITHVPTGTVAIAQEERSQHQNRRLALARLAKLFQRKQQSAEAASDRNRWQQHAALQRGNAVRVYRGKKFALRKK